MAKQDTYKRTQIRLPEYEYERIKEIAEIEGKSLNQLFIDITSDYIFHFWGKARYGNQDPYITEGIEESADKHFLREEVGSLSPQDAAALLHLIRKIKN